MKIALGILSNRGFQPNTIQSLLNLIEFSKKKYNFKIILGTEGYDIAENRNYITVQALNNKSDYLLMIDDDMVFPPDTLDRLLANKKDICGVAFHPRIDKMKTKDETHFENLKSKKLFEAKAIGTGIILIKCDIFLNIPRPWFFFTWLETGQCKNGEDWNFCFKAKEAGYKIYCDPTIPIKHIGEIIY